MAFQGNKGGGKKYEYVLFFYLSPALELPPIGFSSSTLSLSLSHAAVQCARLSPLLFIESLCTEQWATRKKRKRKGVWRGGDSLTPSISHTQSNHPSKAFTNNSSKTPPMPPPKLHTYTHTPAPRVNSHLFSGSSSGSRHHHWRWQQPFSLSCPLLLFVYLARPHAVSSLGEKKRARGCTNMMRKERGREGRVNRDHHEARENITEKEKQ